MIGRLQTAYTRGGSSPGGPEDRPWSEGGRDGGEAEGEQDKGKGGPRWRPCMTCVVRMINIMGWMTRKSVRRGVGWCSRGGGRGLGRYRGRVWVGRGGGEICAWGGGEPSTGDWGNVSDWEDEGAEERDWSLGMGSWGLMGEQPNRQGWGGRRSLHAV